MKISAAHMRHVEDKLESDEASYEFLKILASPSLGNTLTLVAMLSALNRIAHHLPRPSHFGRFPRRIRHHVGQAVDGPVRVETGGSVINPSTAQDERNGHPAFPPRRVFPSRFKSLFSVTLFPTPTKWPTARHKFHRIRSPILPPTVTIPQLTRLPRPPLPGLCRQGRKMYVERSKKRSGCTRPDLGGLYGPGR